MKKLVLLTLFAVSAHFSFSQAVVYLNIGSHNESGSTDPNYSTTLNYINYSTLVKQLADSVISKHAKWNFQSDYKFLLGCINHDPHSAATGGNNLLYWMNHSFNIETDPHCHEGLYNWADIAKLHDSLGCTNRTVVGGIDPYSYRWQEMQNPISGNTFPTYQWQADLLWGFASPGHGFNDETYGIWRPQDTAHIYTDAPSNHLRYIGNGCSNVVFSTSTAHGVMDTLRMILNKIQNNTAPSTGFYTATIMCNVRDFNSAFVLKMATIIDSVKPYVDAGKVVWATLQEKDSIWAADYASNAFIWNCSDVLSISEYNSIDFNAYPNPANTAITINFDNAITEKRKIQLFDILGKEVAMQEISNENSMLINTSTIKEGVYICKITGTNSSGTRRICVVH